MGIRRRPAWQLPDGVSSGTWDYAHTDHIATDYDSYFSDHGMFRLDEQVAARHFQSGKSVIDLGCGTGRALLPLVRRGLSGVAFDLSQAMLREVLAKARATGIPDGQLRCVRGNLVELDCFAENSFDYAMCLFSTLGMIRGSQQRAVTTQHVARMLKPGGLFVFQVHNYWAHLFDPEGPGWMIRNLARRIWKRDVERGDLFYLYRGVPDMYLHSFTKREVRRLLRTNRFEVVEWIPLNAEQSGKLSVPWMLEPLRASGWLVVARLSTANG